MKRYKKRERVAIVSICHQKVNGPGNMMRGRWLFPPGNSLSVGPRSFFQEFSNIPQRFLTSTDICHCHTNARCLSQRSCAHFHTGASLSFLTILFSLPGSRLLPRPRL